MRQYDLIGIGIGPFNLSLAALLTKVQTLHSCFFETNSEFSWHPGMLFSDAMIQVNHFYDLVTLVDPTNPYSFLAYLAAHKRLYRFANSNFKRILRREFNDYFAWVSRQLVNLHFAEEVLDVTYANETFSVNTTQHALQSKHLVLGSGLTPYIPAFAKPYIGKKVYHCNTFLQQAQDWKNQRIVVVGGGQSGAEVFQHLLKDENNLPLALNWISKRDSFLPMDETPFTDEIYTPLHSESYYRQSSMQKQQMAHTQLLSSDGITAELLENIYQRLYVLESLCGYKNRIKLLPRHALTAMSHDLQLEILNTHLNQHALIKADIVIFCTGFHWELPAFLSSLKDKIEFDAQGKFKVKHDFSIAWAGASANQIYVQNGARHTHGVADPNLSLAAWRSAKIINSMAGEELYQIDNEESAIQWDAILTNQFMGLDYAANT